MYLGLGIATAIAMGLLFVVNNMLDFSGGVSGGSLWWALLPRPEGSGGWSPVGLAMGIASAALFLLAGLFSGRKRLIRRVMSWNRKRPGDDRARTDHPRGANLHAWLPMHISLGVTSFVMALAHAGFQVGYLLTALLLSLTAVEAAAVRGLCSLPARPIWDEARQLLTLTLKVAAALSIWRFRVGWLGWTGL